MADGKAVKTPIWAMPSRILIKSTGEVGRLHLIYYDYDDDGNDLLIVQLDDGRQIKVLGSDAKYFRMQEPKDQL